MAEEEEEGEEDEEAEEVVEKARAEYGWRHWSEPRDRYYRYACNGRVEVEW